MAASITEELGIGNAVLSRWPISESKIRRLPAALSPTRGGGPLRADRPPTRERPFLCDPPQLRLGPVRAAPAAGCRRRRVHATEGSARTPRSSLATSTRRPTPTRSAVSSARRPLRYGASSWRTPGLMRGRFRRAGRGTGATLTWRRRSSPTPGSTTCSRVPRAATAVGRSSTSTLLARSGETVSGPPTTSACSRCCGVARSNEKPTTTLKGPTRRKPPGRHLSRQRRRGRWSIRENDRYWHWEIHPRRDRYSWPDSSTTRTRSSVDARAWKTSRSYAAQRWWQWRTAIRHCRK
jgi:hypothetical protein